ncbi:MAG: response regulator [Chthoniobacteraceae bacterium]|nr:response regulator [Chthoniobacteraceae bacterium]
MRLLIADDDRELACAMASYLRHSNNAIISTVTTGGVDVLRSVKLFDPDVILMDILMPRLNGLTVCRHILSTRPDVRIILLSGVLHSGHPFVAESGAAGFVAKPVRLAELQRVFDEIIPREAAASASPALAPSALPPVVGAVHE